MPVLKKQFDIGSKKVWIRQASGMERMYFESKLAKAFRKFRHFGTDQNEWSEEQQSEFVEYLDDAGAGMSSQMERLIPPCILDENVDINSLDSDELMTIFTFIRGEDQEGSVPLV